MKFLMATDGSRHATSALLAAGRMLARTDREVDLMSVVPSVDPKRKGEANRLLRRAQRMLDKSKEVLAEAGVEVRTLIKTGSPIRTLIGASYNYDLTVIAAASHRAGPMAGLGPVAGRVAEHANGSVFIAREGGTGGGGRILVTLDGSEGSLRALQTLTELIEVGSAEVTLLHVVETPWLHAGPDQEWLGFEEEEEEEIDPQAQLEKEFVKEGDDIVAAARQQLPFSTAAIALVRQGLPADEILSEADSGEYDLIVVGTSGATDLKHLLLGSVSSKVVWNAPCSVLLVRSAGEP